MFARTCPYVNELAEQYNLTRGSIRQLIRKYKLDNRSDIEDAIKDLIAQKLATQRMIDRFKDELNLIVSGPVEASRILRSTTNYASTVLDATVSNMLNLLDLIKWSKEYDYEWVLVGREPFTYNDIHYKNLADFCRHFKIIKQTLLNNLLKYEGDLRLAILHSQDDPEYNKVIKFEVGNWKFDSINEAGEALGFSGATFRRYLRQGKTQEEAYRMCLANKYVDVEEEYGFPILFKGESCSNRAQLGRACNLDIRRLTKHIEEIGLEETVYKLENNINFNPDLQIAKEISEKYQLPVKEVTRIKARLKLSYPEVDEKFEKEQLYYNNNLIYSFQQIGEIEGINPKRLGMIWREAVEEEEDINERSRKFAEGIKSALSKPAVKTSSIFSK